MAEITRRAALAGIGTAPLAIAEMSAAAAIALDAAPGADAELMRLMAEMEPRAIEYAEAQRAWHRAEEDFDRRLFAEGRSMMSIIDGEGLDAWFARRQRHGVEAAVEVTNEIAGRLDKIVEAVKETPASTIDGLRVKLFALLSESGYLFDDGFKGPELDLVVESVDAFLGDVRAFLGAPSGPLSSLTPPARGRDREDG